MPRGERISRAFKAPARPGEGIAPEERRGSVVEHSGTTIFFLSTARYRVMPPFSSNSQSSRSLNDDTTRKKFQLLEGLGEIWVVGFSGEWSGGSFIEGRTHYVLLPTPPWALLRYLLWGLSAPLIASFVSVRQRGVVLIAQSPLEGVAGVLGRVCARIFGRKASLVIESHGDFERGLFLYRTVAMAGVIGTALRAIARFTVGRADALRAISRATAAQLRRYNSRSPVVTFPAWSDIDLFIREGNQNHPRAERVLFVGAHTRTKGVVHLIRAFAQVRRERPNAELTLIGERPDPEYDVELERTINESGVKECVTRIPWRSQGELAREVATAALLVLPSISEGLGRVIIESMAAGTPVVASSVGGIPELIDHGESGLLVPAGDDPALADAILSLLNDPQLWHRLAKGGSARVVELFTPERYLHGYRALMDAAESHRKGRA